MMDILTLILILMCVKIDFMDDKQNDDNDEIRGKTGKRAMKKRTGSTHSDSTSATVHLYCAVENKQMSANCLTDTLIFFTVLLELFAICTFTARLSP